MLDAIRETVAGSPIPLVVALAEEPDTPVMLTNDAFRRMVGRADGDILGRNCRFMQGALTTDVQRRVFTDALHRSSPCRGLITNYTAQGRVFLNYVLMFPIRDPATGMRAVLGSQFDLTPRPVLDIAAHAHRLAEVLNRVGGPEQGSALLGALDTVATTVGRLVQARLDATRRDAVDAATQMARWTGQADRLS